MLNRETRRILLIIFITGLMCLNPLSPALSEAERSTPVVQVEIKGLEGRLLKNVMASLKIYKYRNSSRLNGPLIKRYHSRALAEIKAAMAPFGYLNPKVTSQLKHTNAHWKAVYIIRPGKRIKIGRINIKITGPGRVDIKKAFGLKKGDPFIQFRYEQAKKEILNSLYTQGYAKAHFTKSVVKVDRGKGTAEITLIIESGPRHYFGETIFHQNDFLEPDLLQRMLPYAEGDPYSPEKLLALQRRLESSRYFSEVLVESKLSEISENEIPVAVTLKPGESRSYTLGVGYGTDTGMRGKAKLECRRCNKKGHIFEAEAELSEREQHIFANYIIPIGHPDLHSIATRAALSREETVDRVSNMATAGLSYGRNQGTWQYSCFAELRGEDYRAGEDRHSSLLLMPGMRFSLIRAASRLRTSRGLRLDAELSGASKGLLSDTTFLRGTLFVKAIYPIADPLRLVTRLDLGAALIDNFSRLPASLRFYAGGTQSVRGYRYKSLSPRDDSGDLIGGRYLLTGSLELEYALKDHLGLALFYDAGNAMDDFSQGLKQGAGAGLRWNFSFGQVRLDLASALNRRGRPLRIHFSIGTDL